MDCSFVLAIKNYQNLIHKTNHLKRHLKTIELELNNAILKPFTKKQEVKHKK